MSLLCIKDLYTVESLYIRNTIREQSFHGPCTEQRWPFSSTQTVHLGPGCLAFISYKSAFLQGWLFNHKRGSIARSSV